MELYLLGFLFAYGILLVDVEHFKGWKGGLKMLIGCLIWPILLGSIVGELLEELKNGRQQKNS